MRKQDAVSHALRALEGTENACGWGRQPLIHLIYLKPNGNVTAGNGLIPPELRAAVTRPAELIEYFAQFIEQSGARRTRRAGAFACSFMAEAWQVQPKPGLPSEVYERMLAAADHHELYRHPGRQEVRGLWAMDREGWFYELRRPRHGQPNLHVVSPGDPSMQAVGLIPDALRRISEKLR
jgi:hypothetical protein